ncbi:MAG: thioredoxin [Anaerolineae bacterium]|nr:thioredoxin [Anaerolineae bacterium]
MGQLQSVNAGNFDQVVLQATMPILVDFWAEWCPPCQKLGPMLEELAPEIDDIVTIVKANVKEAKDLAINYGVMNIPTMILFKGGEEIHRMVGFSPKEKLRQEIKNKLGF